MRREFHPRSCPEALSREILIQYTCVRSYENLVDLKARLVAETITSLSLPKEAKYISLFYGSPEVRPSFSRGNSSLRGNLDMGKIEQMF